MCNHQNTTKLCFFILSACSSLLLPFLHFQSLISLPTLSYFCSPFLLFLVSSSLSSFPFIFLPSLFFYPFFSFPSAFSSLPCLSSRQASFLGSCFAVSCTFSTSVYVNHKLCHLFMKINLNFTFIRTVVRFTLQRTGKIFKSALILVLILLLKE